MVSLLHEYSLIIFFFKHGVKPRCMSVYFLALCYSQTRTPFLGYFKTKFAFHFDVANGIGSDISKNV
jgi:hypothetical protein